MAAPADFYTYRQDIRPFGNGSVISYLEDPAVTDLAEGEMVGLGSAGLARWLTNGGGLGTLQTQAFVGITRDSNNKMASLGNQTPLSAFVSLRFGVFTTGVHVLIGKTGDTFNHGQLVYRDGVENRVTETKPTDGVPVGTVYLPDLTTATGDQASHNVPVLIDGFTLSQKAQVIGSNPGGASA